jgi:hypothetical protein
MGLGNPEKQQVACASISRASLLVWRSCCATKIRSFESQVRSGQPYPAGTPLLLRLPGPQSPSDPRPISMMVNEAVLGARRGTQSLPLHPVQRTNADASLNVRNGPEADT